MKGYAPGWQARCCTCRLTFDAGDLGMDIVFKFLFGKQCKLLWCQQCQAIRSFSVEKSSEGVKPAGPRCDLTTHQKTTGGNMLIEK